METRLVRCPHFDATNRVPLDRVEAGGRPDCGRCKAPVPIDLPPVIVTGATFAEEVERSPLPVVLDLRAPWCGRCRMFAPVTDRLAYEMAGRVRFAELNVDENPWTASRSDARSIPTLLVLQGGREVDRMIGAQPKAEIVRRVELATA
jgi:thioredoxin 2